MKKLLWVSYISLYTIVLSGQIDLSKLSGLKARNLGPAGMSGRVISIDMDLKRDYIYVGTASGGLWKSTSGGTSWEALFDKEVTQAIGAVQVNQNNPDEIWVGTGEGNPRNSMNSGAGMFKSLDAGKTWKYMGLKETRNIHRVIIHRDNPAIVYAGAIGSAWGPTPDRGVYRTTDGGKTWSRILFVNDQTGVADLVADPTNPNKLIAAMWEYGRKPHYFNSGGPGSGLYITYDGGDNWTKLTSEAGLPKGTLGRIGLAIAPSKPDIVYALIECDNSGLYKSTDGGKKWNLVTTENVSNRPFYYHEIYVDPQNENRLFNLYSSLTRSEDGGKTWTDIDGSAVNGIHPDHHAYWIHPARPEYMINGNDGGLNISQDGGNTWRFVNNLALGQFYHIDYDLDLPYNVYGGLQDNGSWVGPAYMWQQGAIRNHEWQELYFGDGFDVLPRRDNSRYGYAMSQGGNVAYYDRHTGRTTTIRPIHPDGVKLRFNWNAAIAENPFHPCGVYYGSQFIHKSLDCGQTWAIISPDLTTNDTSKQKAHISGGLTFDATGAENYTTIITIAPSPLDEQVIWVGTDDGNVQLTRDGGKSWTNLTSKLPGCPAMAWIPQIVASTYKAGEAFVIVNNYRQNDWKPYAYRTADFGQTWTRIVDEKDVDAFTLSIVQDPVEPNLMFLGTDFGLYVSFDGSVTWQKWMHDYPSVPTEDLKIHPREHDLIIGTFGRAVYILDDIRPLREIARTKGEVLKKNLAVFSPPSAYLVSNRSYDGMHFPGSAEFAGPNRPSGAIFTVWMKENDKKPEPDGGRTAAAGGPGRRGGPGGGRQEAKIYLFNSAGDSIRTLTRTLESGMNRLVWGLERNGARFPGGGGRFGGGDGAEPGGPTVLPGTYKAIFVFGKEKDSTEIVVQMDPRADYTAADLQTREKDINDYLQFIKKANDAYAQLTTAENTLKVVSENAASLSEPERNDLKKKHEALQSKIDGLKALFATPANVRGIEGTDRLTSYLFRGYSFINASRGPIGANAKNAIKEAKTQTGELLTKVQAFFEQDFKTYQESVEKMTFKLFKPYTPVKL